MTIPFIKHLHLTLAADLCHKFLVATIMANKNGYSGESDQRSGKSDQADMSQGAGSTVNCSAVVGKILRHFHVELSAFFLFPKLQLRD